ncbi:secreted RxLR effector protein 161-like [Tasmannia lanceolata]|uniref:secreted RxLR effector protein 161-like n=1 Tax=Tasmannia lanceolata TaxID=3420 RepID=UPI004064248C
MLKKYGYFDLAELSIPYDYNQKLHANTGRTGKQLEYSKTIGCLIYAMSCTRPDIVFSVGMLRKFKSNPEGFSNATWCSEPDESRSTGGFVFTLGAKSSMESEFFALESAEDEVEWLKDLLLDLPMRKLRLSAITFFCDNQAVSTAAENKLFNGRKMTLLV